MSISVEVNTNTFSTLDCRATRSFAMNMNVPRFCRLRVKRFSWIVNIQYMFLRCSVLRRTYRNDTYLVRIQIHMHGVRLSGYSCKLSDHSNTIALSLNAYRNPTFWARPPERKNNVPQRQRIKIRNQRASSRLRVIVSNSQFQCIVCYSVANSYRNIENPVIHSKQFIFCYFHVYN